MPIKPSFNHGSNCWRMKMFYIYAMPSFTNTVCIKIFFYLKRISIFSFILFQPAVNAFCQASASTPVKLQAKTFFGCFTIGLPDNIVLTSDTSKNNQFNYIVVFANEKDSVDVMIQKKNPKDLKGMKDMQESWASSFYHGQYQKSEFENVNGRDLLVFLMTGYWNGATSLSTWLKCYTISNGKMYEFMIRFPKDYKKYPQDLLDEIIRSVRICKQ